MARKATRQEATQEVPTLGALLSTFSYHVESIIIMRPRKGLETQVGCEVVKTGFGLGYGPGCPAVHVDCEIHAAVGEADPWGISAQVWMAPHGQPLQLRGNRCGGRETYAALCAPVLAWAAAQARAK